MTKMKTFIAVALFLGMASVAQASQVSKGAFAATLFSSGIVAAGQGTFLGTVCSTPGSAQPLTVFVQYFDTGTNLQSSMQGGNIFATINNSTIAITPSLTVNFATTTISGSLGTGWDFSGFGGIHYDTGLYYYIGGVGGAAGPPVCTTYWRRDNE